MQKKINKIKIFFGEINKIDNPLYTLTKEKGCYKLVILQMKTETALQSPQTYKD